MARRAAPWGEIAFATAVVVSLTFGAPAAHAAGGDLDPAFGGGTVTTTLPGGGYANAVAIQGDGRIVAVGATAGATNRGEMAIARYLADGSLDVTFGGDGIVTTPIAGGGDEARSVAIAANGRVVVAGTDSGGRFALVRYMPDGSLDASFGGDGIVRTNVTPGDDVAWDVAIQRDGKIVAAGGAGFGQQGFFLARYHTNGSLDRIFGDGGTVVTRYRGANGRAVAIQRNGRIVVAGYNSRGLALARYRPDGRLDRSFAGDGLVGAVVPQVFALAVTLQANDRIVVAGDHDIFSVGIARFRSDGRIDRSFGGDGVVSTQIGTGEQAFNGLVIQPDGRIVGAGYAGPHEFGDPTPARFVLARYTPGGALDTSFGGDGTIETPFDGGAHAAGIARQADGRLVVAGGFGAADGFALARYLA